MRRRLVWKVSQLMPLLLMILVFCVIVSYGEYTYVPDFTSYLKSHREYDGLCNPSNNFFSLMS